MSFGRLVGAVVSMGAGAWYLAHQEAIGRICRLEPIGSLYAQVQRTTPTSTLTYGPSPLRQCRAWPHPHNSKPMDIWAHDCDVFTQEYLRSFLGEAQKGVVSKEYQLSHCDVYVNTPDGRLTWYGKAGGLRADLPQVQKAQWYSAGDKAPGMIVIGERVDHVAIENLQWISLFLDPKEHTYPHPHSHK